MADAGWKGEEGEESGDGKALFRLASSVWVSSGADIKDSFLRSVAVGFGPSVFPVDFADGSGAGRAAVNDWALDVTEGRVTDLVGEDLPPDTAMLLASAVYLKGRWADPFDRGLTERAEFKAPGGPAAADLMARTGRYGYLEDEFGQALELPYEGGRLSMVVLLPKEGEGGLAALEAASGAAVAARLGRLATQEVDARIPRFSFSWGARSLVAPLRALGVSRAFSDGAEFPGMSQGPGMKISDVIHKAFVAVDEEGTEAAAATGVEVGPTSLAIAAPPPALFRADRPFLFLIRDKATGAVIFLGRFSGPPE
jgi:serpin B